MEPLKDKNSSTPSLFILSGIVLLATGLLFGLLGAMQYLMPGFLKSYLSFERVRPLHVSSVVFWIIFAAIGGVLTYLQQYTGKPIFSKSLLRIQFIVLGSTVGLILLSYSFGIFGGREYWEFEPLLAIPIIAAWIVFLINFVKSTVSFRRQPVYVWMWLTGIICFLFTFLESYLWIFPYFRNHVVNDMTIQWKSYGSMVGAWNMLIYGSGIFLMDKISGEKKYSHSRIAFALYFTGLFNLMFNWGHHIYTLPTFPSIQYISYAVSMTELLILGRIIWQWKSTVTTAQKHFHHLSYRFIIAADVWIFLNLLLAIMMSVPAINVYTHGTHITVAHTMGATIGINSFLLLAIAFDILKDTCMPIERYKKWITANYWITNISLFIFWMSLIAAGVWKAKWQMSATQIPFSSMMQQLKPFFIIFFITGFIMMVSFLMLLYPLISNYITCNVKKRATTRKTKSYQSVFAIE